MKKNDLYFKTSAIRRAAHGQIRDFTDDAFRAVTVYGFSNFALKKSKAEISSAWDSASALIDDENKVELHD